jgi:D-alanyl-D-alanine carboxypeptidase
LQRGKTETGMKIGRTLAFSALAPFVFAMLAACSASVGQESDSPQANIVTPTSAETASAAGELTSGDPPVEGAAIETPTDGTTPAEGAPVETDAPAPPTTSHVALKYLIGNIDPATDPMFARIPDKYIGGSRVWGHKDAVAAFVRMAEDAASNGYKLKILSSFRSFTDQKKIWEDKWTGKTLVGGKKLNVSLPDPTARALKILEFSSMPGTSRHHWGTDFDINALDNKYFTTREGKRVYDWLIGHAANYGFCQVYTKKGEETGRTTGYEEKWHWSYRPVADWYLKQYPIDVGYERLTGFEGAATAKDIDVIANYVQGIDPECKQ